MYIGIDGNNVKLLSRYILNVGNHPNPIVPLGLQSAELGLTRPSLTSEPIDYYVNDNTVFHYGGVPFTNSLYWWDSSNSTYVSPYTINSFVYNEQASISNYVNDYVNTLITKGLDVTNGTLLSLEEASILCHKTITGPGGYLGDCPNYLFETSYWLGSVQNSFLMWSTNPGGSLHGLSAGTDNYIGVRPVITISLT